MSRWDNTRLQKPWKKSLNHFLSAQIRACFSGIWCWALEHQDLPSGAQCNLGLSTMTVGFGQLADIRLVILTKDLENLAKAEYLSNAVCCLHCCTELLCTQKDRDHCCPADYELCVMFEVSILNHSFPPLQSKLMLVHWKWWWTPNFSFNDIDLKSVEVVLSLHFNNCGAGSVVHHIGRWSFVWRLIMAHSYICFSEC